MTLGASPAAPSMAFRVMGVLYSFWTFVLNYVDQLTVPYNAKRLVNELLSAEGNGEDVGVSDGVASARRRSPFINALAQEARAKFGLMSRTEANRMIVGDWMRKYCVEQHVRTKHIAKLVPIAIVWYFVPTESDIIAESIFDTAPVIQKVWAYERRRTWVGWVLSYVSYFCSWESRSRLGFSKK